MQSASEITPTNFPDSSTTGPPEILCFINALITSWIDCSGEKTTNWLVIIFETVISGHIRLEHLNDWHPIYNKGQLVPFFVKRFLIPSLAAFALPAAVNAEIDKETAEFCLKATDFAGCVETMKRGLDSIRLKDVSSVFLADKT